MLEISKVGLSRDGQSVLHDITLDIANSEIVCLLGPSGCGKTTLLRTIAGLEKPDTGDIRVDGHSILSIPVHKRDFGLMFQDYALFPHLDVRGNILFGLQMRQWPPEQAEARLRAVLHLVNLTGLEKRAVTELSGGERQRVALARSLAPNPRLLMLDEPLASIDAVLRDQLVAELRAIIKQTGLTSIYVTHDQREAFAVADRIAIMRDGSLEQIAPPAEIYARPATVFAAEFLGLNNIVPILSRRENMLITPFGNFDLPAESKAVLFHPDGIALNKGGSHQQWLALTGRVLKWSYLGSSCRITILSDIDQVALTFSVPAEQAPAPADRLTVYFDLNYLRPLA